jgi:hypothetical protein
MVATHGTISLLFDEDNNIMLNKSLNYFASPKLNKKLLFLRGKGKNDAVIEMVATLSNLNHILSNFLFLPAANYFGNNAMLELIVNDLGNFGSGGAKEDKRSFWFQILPRNDPPSISIPLTLDGSNYPRYFTLNEGGCE